MSALFFCIDCLACEHFIIRWIGCRDYCTKGENISKIIKKSVDYYVRWTHNDLTGTTEVPATKLEKIMAIIRNLAGDVIFECEGALSGADLSGADLSQADLSGANLTGVRGYKL